MQTNCFAEITSKQKNKVEIPNELNVFFHNGCKKKIPKHLNIYCRYEDFRIYNIYRPCPSQICLHVMMYS